MNDTPERIEASIAALVEPIDAIVSDPANARRHPQRNLDIIKGSLAGFGQQKPIVVDGDGVCIAGNGTLEAARALGWKRIAVVRTSLRGAAARAYSIADNRATDTSEWDEPVLAQHLDALTQDNDVDHLLTGFTQDQIERWLEEAAQDAAPAEVQVKDSYSVLVACADEAQQKRVYEQLTSEGLSCRVLTL
jgi:ParB-like chromosome segregation protein Spo0J